MPAAGSPMPHDRREDLQNGRRHDRGPEVVTVWAAGGENLNTKYGAGNANELANGRPMVKTGTVGGCARYGGVQGVTFEYHYLNVLEEDAADNEVVRIVIEDTVDADGNSVRRTA